VTVATHGAITGANVMVAISGSATATMNTLRAPAPPCLRPIPSTSDPSPHAAAPLEPGTAADRGPGA